MNRNERMKLLSPSMIAAIATIERAVPTVPAERAEFDQVLVMLRQQLRIAREAHDAAALMVHQAKITELRALASLEELKIRIELREEQLGIEHDESEDQSS
jgi:hypothetical protein